MNFQFRGKYLFRKVRIYEFLWRFLKVRKEKLFVPLLEVQGRGFAWGYTSEGVATRSGKYFAVWRWWRGVLPLLAFLPSVSIFSPDFPLFLICVRKVFRKNVQVERFVMNKYSISTTYYSVPRLLKSGKYPGNWKIPTLNPGWDFSHYFRIVEEQQIVEIKWSK
jgi:hypothetical protein